MDMALALGAKRAQRGLLAGLGSEPRDLVRRPCAAWSFWRPWAFRLCQQQDIPPRSHPWPARQVVSSQDLRLTPTIHTDQRWNQATDRSDV